MMGKVLFSLINTNHPQDQNGQGNPPKGN